MFDWTDKATNITNKHIKNKRKIETDIAEMTLYDINFQDLNQQTLN